MWSAAHTSEGKRGGRGFCVGVGLVGALCGTELCAGKRAWLVLAGLHGTPPRFPSCLSFQFHPPCFPSGLSLHSFPSVIFAAFPHVSPATLYVQSFSLLSLSSLAHSAHPQPLHFKVFLACDPSTS